MTSSSSSSSFSCLHFPFWSSSSSLVPLIPLLLLLLLIIGPTNGQFSAQTYPDPRIDPFSCRLILPGQVCDPAEILTADERRLLNEKITKLQQITANIKNSSPSCTDATRNSNLVLIVALIEKLGTLPFDARGEAVNIEKFTNQLRSKYQNYQDATLCDPLVLIVNSRSDRQVFTVAGRDAKLSRDMLQTAFHRNVGHFRVGNYAMGLEGMAELIVSAYGSAHIVQTPAGDGVLSPPIQVPPAALMPSSSGTGQFIAHGVRQKQDKLQRIELANVPEEDKLWTKILIKALAQCGDEPNKLPKYVRAIVEEAMDISLKLISDPRYNKIEEEAQDAEKAPNARDKAWTALKEYFDELYAKLGQIPTNIDQCPAQRGGGGGVDERFLRIVRLKN